MNHIQRLTAEREELRAALLNTLSALVDIEAYLCSDKFHGPDADYVHVRTDILPKISEVRFAASCATYDVGA